MTRQQRAMVEKIRHEAETLHGKNSDDYEIKEFKVTEEDWNVVTVWVVIGLKNDEGSMAEVLCRDDVQLFIGPRGAVRFYVTRKQKSGNYKTYAMKYRGLWNACYEYSKH